MYMESVLCKYIIINIQGKKYEGAAGEFAPEIPIRAPEIGQQSDYGGDIKKGSPKSPP